MNRKQFLKCAGALTGMGLAMNWGAAQSRARPNVIFILTDNHGAWTLGCYGNPDIKTPNLDRMAREGVLFTRSFSNNAVCSPTRATYLTGLMPSQNGVHKFVDKSVMLGPDAYPCLEEFDTLPQILYDSGYVCGLSGKWHLGDHLHPQEGFSFWVTMTGGGTVGFMDQTVIENGETHVAKGHLTDYWTKRGIEFIVKNQDRPFFLYLAYNGPYGLGKSALTESQHRQAAQYEDKDLPSFTRDAPHPWLFNNRDMLNNPVSIRKYASEVSAIDEGVGIILAKLKELGLDENTLVVFTGDQGWSGGQSGFWGMGDHTRPLTAYDWGMHVPLIVRHPGKVVAGKTVDAMVSNYDLLPTLLDYLGMPEKQPKHPAPPGRSYAPFLLGEDPEWENIIFYEFENVRAVRTDQWKYIERIKQKPNELFDVVNDPGERLNLYGAPEHADIQEALQARLHAFFKRHSEPKYDLWNGGTAKGGLLVFDKL